MALTKVSTEGIKNLTIKDEDISNSAAINASKISGLATDKVNEGNTSVEVIDAQGNNDIGVIKADLGITSNAGQSVTESNYFHSTKSGNDYTTEINQAHNGNNNTFKLSVGNTGGDGKFVIEKGPSGGDNAGILKYSANSGGGQWRLTTAGQHNYSTTQTTNIFAKDVVPESDSQIKLGTATLKWSEVHVDDLKSDYLHVHDIVLNRDANNAEPMIIPGSLANITYRTTTNASGAYGSILDGSGLQLGRNTAYVKIKAPADQTGQASYDLTLPINAGTNGQALVTNGSGVTSWAAVSAGGASNISFNSGNGIDFSATADGTGSGSTSEIFDDYEEGTWTGAIETGSANIGGEWYIKTGGYVVGGGNITAIGNTSSSNAIRVTGLPFSSSGGGSAPGAVAGSKISTMNNACMSQVSGSSVYFLTSSTSTGSWDYIKHQHVNQSSGSITFAFHYYCVS